MKQDIFETAREHISPGLIERMFSTQKAKWDKNEYWTLSPLRDDRSIGSFHISESGLFYDHATGEKGDFIDLVCAKYKMTKRQAAEYIIEQSGGVVDTRKKKTKKTEKPKPLIPIPDEALKKFNDYLKTKWMIDNIGPVTMGWQYRNDKKELLFCVCRHEPEGKKKDVRPYYWDGTRWQHGNPFKNGIPLYGLDRDLSKPVLIVEGEKCADIKVDGYTVLTWCGGPNQVKKADWSVLKECDIIIWPDYDQGKDKNGEIFPNELQPGLSAAIDIKNILPQSKILNTYNKNFPEKYDIFDANESGVDLIKFIKECGDYEIEKNVPEDYDVDILDNTEIPIQEKEIFDSCNQTREEIHQGPFRFMGHDEYCHYFLPRGSRIIKKISFGGFSQTKLLELAPLSYWMLEHPKKSKEGYDYNVAVDNIIRCSERVGFYNPEQVRGTGAWFDDGKIIINNGNHCVNGNGKPITDFKSKYFYVHSERKMGKFDGRKSTDAEGAQLVGLFEAQGFESKVESWITLGWSLIAPFAGILSWRPHIWITGPLQCGKSFMLKNMIIPICGPSVERGTGITTAPGVYRSLKSSSAPVVLDEMEPGRDKEVRARVEQKLEIVRNASDDSSSTMTMANKSGGVDRFCVRSPFCLASVMPYMPAAAIESRIQICRLKSFSRTKDKRKITREIMKSGLLSDPGIFRRRIYCNIKTVMDNLETIKKIIYRETHDNRKSENLAPIFAALFMIMSEQELTINDKSKSVISGLLHDMSSEALESDEDKLMVHIFDYQCRTISGEMKSIGELLITSREKSDDTESNSILQRHGIKIHTYKNSDYLAIAKSHQSMNRILDGTQYAGVYYNILKRHPASIEKTVSVRIAKQGKSCILMEWDKIEETYFSESDYEDDKTTALPFEDGDIPL